jgi:prophage regulatory protein
MSPTEILPRESKRKPSPRERKKLRKRRRELREAARAQARSAIIASGGRRILRLAEVEVIVGLKRTQIYDSVAKKTFPKPIALGERAVGWSSDEIEDWQDARIKERDAS